MADYQYYDPNTDTYSLRGVPPRIAQTIRRQERIKSRLGYKDPEPLASNWEALGDLLGTSEYAVTSAWDYARTGRNPLEGLVQGAYEGIRPLGNKMLSSIPGMSGYRLPKGRGRKEFLADYAQTVPGFEPTESTWGNFGTRMLFTGVGIATDPLSYAGLGSEGLFKQGMTTLARKGIVGNVDHTLQALRTADKAQHVQLFNKMAKAMAEEKAIAQGVARIPGLERKLFNGISQDFYKNGPIAIEPFFAPHGIRQKLRIPLVTHSMMERTSLPAFGRMITANRGVKAVKDAIEPALKLAYHEYPDPPMLQPIRKMLFREETIEIPAGRGRPAIIQRMPPKSPLLPDASLPPTQQGRVIPNAQYVAKHPYPLYLEDEEGALNHLTNTYPRPDWAEPGAYPRAPGVVGPRTISPANPYEVVIPKAGGRQYMSPEAAGNTIPGSVTPVAQTGARGGTRGWRPIPPYEVTDVPRQGHPPWRQAEREGYVRPPASEYSMPVGINPEQRLGIVPPGVTPGRLRAEQIKSRIKPPPLVRGDHFEAEAMMDSRLQGARQGVRDSSIYIPPEEMPRPAPYARTYQDAGAKLSPEELLTARSARRAQAGYVQSMPKTEQEALPLKQWKKGNLDRLNFPGAERFRQKVISARQIDPSLDARIDTAVAKAPPVVAAPFSPGDKVVTTANIRATVIRLEKDGTAILKYDYDGAVGRYRNLANLTVTEKAPAGYVAPKVGRIAAPKKPAEPKVSNKVMRAEPGAGDAPRPAYNALVPEHRGSMIHIINDLEEIIQNKKYPFNNPDHYVEATKLPEKKYYHYPDIDEDYYNGDLNTRRFRQQSAAILNEMRENGIPLDKRDFGHNLMYAPADTELKQADDLIKRDAAREALTGEAEYTAQKGKDIASLTKQLSEKDSNVRGMFASSKNEEGLAAWKQELAQEDQYANAHYIRAADIYTDNIDHFRAHPELFPPEFKPGKGGEKPQFSTAKAEAASAFSYEESKHTRMSLQEAVNKGHMTTEEQATIHKLLDVPAYRKNIEVLFQPGEVKVPEAGVRAHGVLSAEQQLMKGVYEAKQDAKDIIAISRRGLNDPETMAHEPFHFAYKRLLYPEERKSLEYYQRTLDKTSKKTTEEWAADQHAKFLLGRPIEKNMWGILRATTKRIWRAIKAVLGDTRSQLEQLFEKALKRPYNPVPGKMEVNRILQSTPKFSLHPGAQVYDVAGVFKKEVGTGEIKKLRLTVFERKPILYLLDNALTWISPTWRMSPVMTEAGRTLKAREITEKAGSIEAARTLGNALGNDEKNLNEFYKFIEVQSTPFVPTAEQLPKFQAAKIIWDAWTDPVTGTIPLMLRSRGMNADFLQNYMTHVYKLDAETYSKYVDILSASAMSHLDKHTLPRTIETIEKALMLGKKPVVNAAVLLGIRIESAQAAVRKWDYLNELIASGISSGLVKKIPHNMPVHKFEQSDRFKGYVIQTRFPQLVREVQGKSRKSGAKMTVLRGYAIREDVAINLAHTFEGFRKPQFALDILFKLTKMWKPLATIYSPKYHLRNMWGNWWNAYLGGLENPVRYLQALALQSDKFAKSLNIEHFVIDGQKVTIAKVREILKQQGVSGHGFFGTDMEALVHEAIMGNRFNKFDPRRYPEYARSFGQFIEDNARNALWLDARMKGKSDVDAAYHVRQFLFDYDHLTPAERRIRDYIFPWWTWARKNVPLQIEQMMRTPGKYSAVGHLQSFFETEQDKRTKRRLAPDWMKDVQAFSSPLFGKTSKGEIRYIMPGAPYEDLTRFASPKEWVNSLNPVLKGGLEQALAMDFFTGRPFYPEGVADDPSLQVQRVEPGWAQIVPKPLWPVLNIHQYVDPDTRKTITVASPRAVHLWKLAFRPGREVMQLADTDRDFATKMINYGTGLSMFPVDEKRAAMMKGYARREKNRAIIRQRYNLLGTPHRRRKIP